MFLSLCLHPQTGHNPPFVAKLQTFSETTKYFTEKVHKKEEHPQWMLLLFYSIGMLLLFNCTGSIELLVTLHDNDLTVLDVLTVLSALGLSVVHACSTTLDR